MLSRFLYVAPFFSPASCFFTACTPESPIQEQAKKHLEHDSIDSTYNKPTYTKLATLPTSKTGDSAALLGTLEIKDGCIYAKTAINELYLIASMNPDIVIAPN